MIGFDFGPNFKLSSLHSALAPLSVLDPLIEWDRPTITLSTKEVANLNFPLPQAGNQIDVLEGVQLHGKIRLNGLGLEFIAQLLSIESLPISGVLPADISQFSLSARREGRIVLIQNVVVVEDLFLQARAQPFSLKFAGKAEVNLFGTQLPEFTLGVGIQTGQTSIEFETTEPWREPLGLRGLTLNHLALKVKTPGPAFEFSGDIAIADKQLILAAEFIGQAPTALVGSLQGELALNTVVTDLVGLDVLPDFLKLTIRDFESHVVSNPLGITIAGKHYPFGLSVSGELSFLGLTVDTTVSIDPQRGIAAEQKMDPITILNDRFFAITAANGSGGPFFSIATFSRPSHPNSDLRDRHFKISGKLKILGATISKTEIMFTGNEGKFDVAQQLTPLVSFSLTGTISSVSRMSGNGRATVGIQKTIDFGTLGSIALQVAVTGVLDFSLNGNNAQAGMKGEVVFQGTGFDLPRIPLDVNGDALLGLAEAVFDRLKSAIEAFLKDPDAWLRWVKDNVIQGLANGAKDVGKALKDAYNYTEEQIARAGREVLEYSAETVAFALRGADATADAASKAMKEVGYTVEETADAIRNAFDDIDDIDIVIGHIDTPEGPHVDTPSGPYNIPPHVDTHIPPHVDETIHIDT